MVEEYMRFPIFFLIFLSQGIAPPQPCTENRGLLGVVTCGYWQELKWTAPICTVVVSILLWGQAAVRPLHVFLHNLFRALHSMMFMAERRRLTKCSCTIGIITLPSRFAWCLMRIILKWNHLLLLRGRQDVVVGILFMSFQFLAWRGGTLLCSPRNVFSKLFRSSSCNPNRLLFFFFVSLRIHWFRLRNVKLHFLQARTYRHGR